MKGVSLAVCGIFLVLVSTGMASGVTNIVKAQLTEGVNGEGGFSSIECGPFLRFSGEIRFSASAVPSGAINSGEILITVPGEWTGSIITGTFSTTSYELAGQLTGSPGPECDDGTGRLVPQIGDTFFIIGNCGNNVPIQFSMSNNQIRGTFTGNVQCIVPDTTPPVITIVNNPSPVQATGPQGAVVTYIVTATDGRDGQVTPTCTPPSGSTFPVGFTVVRCTATDSAGNTATLVFTVTVTPQPPPAIPTPPPDTDCAVPSSPGVIAGTEGSDILTGTPGNDIMLGLGGNDRMSGVDGNDRMNGCSGNDSVNGNAGNDGISGGTGNDSVSGGDGDDNVQGGEGNDIVSGNGGTNTLTGGRGSDRFVCGPNGDTVTDFQPGQDVMVGPCILPDMLA